MPNIAYFEIPADNVDRAKHFYKNLLGWKIEPIKTLTMDLKSMEAIQYNEITLGEPTPGTINMGGLYKRQGDETIKNYVMVDDIDKVVAKVEKLGGKITTLTPAQAEYISVSADGPFKPEYYRY